MVAKKFVFDGPRRFSTTSHSVWGRVVPDVPDFCRELVAALDENYSVRHIDTAIRWV